MPVITLYRHGATAGTPPMVNNHVRAKRGKVAGWSQQATRRNTKFLYSVDEPELTGVGYAVTLTVRDCPPDSRAWHRLRRAWEKRLQRAGMIRLHWVTEWQRRGMPHLHAALWLPRERVDRMGDSLARNAIMTCWLMAGAWDYGAELWAQDVKPITGAVGWLKYLSKHAARGVQHYQRNPDGIPDAWMRETGRVWGKSGDWPVSEPRRLVLCNHMHDGDGGYFAFRRLVRSWRVADARESGDVRRLRSARGMLSCSNRALSEVRGVSEWVGADVQHQFLANLAERGFLVVDEQTGELVEAAGHGQVVKARAATA